MQRCQVKLSCWCCCVCIKIHLLSQFSFTFAIICNTIFVILLALPLLLKHDTIYLDLSTVSLFDNDTSWYIILDQYKWLAILDRMYTRTLKYSSRLYVWLSYHYLVISPFLNIFPTAIFIINIHYILPPSTLFRLILKEFIIPRKSIVLFLAETNIMVPTNNLVSSL